MPRQTPIDPSFLVLGTRLRELRKARQFSLTDLERASGVQKGSLSLIERGRINMTIGTLRRIAAGLDVDIIEIFCLWDDDPKYRRILAVFDDARREALMERPPDGEDPSRG